MNISSVQNCYDDYDNCNDIAPSYYSAWGDYSPPQEKQKNMNIPQIIYKETLVTHDNFMDHFVQCSICQERANYYLMKNRSDHTDNTPIKHIYKIINKEKKTQNDNYVRQEASFDLKSLLTIMPLRDVLIVVIISLIIFLCIDILFSLMKNKKY